MLEEQGGIYFGVGLDTRELQADAARVRGEIRSLGGAVEREGSRMDSLSRRIGQAMAAGFAGSQLLGFASKIVSVRGEMQQLEIAFTSMLGSKERAEGLMAQMVSTAAHTPFDLQSIAGGAKQLLAYGAEAETVNETLVQLGDVASGIGAPLNDIVYLYGTTMAQGRLYTQDLNQFTGRGIPMIKELAKQFNVTEGEVKGLVEQGKVGFPEVQRVIESLTGAGGMFHNLMAEQSKSLSGQISNLGDSFSMMLNDIGQQSEGAFSSAIGAVNFLVENYRDVAEAIGAVVASHGAYKAAVMATAAIANARQGVRYAEEARQLEALLSAEQRALISQQGLTRGSEAYAGAVRQAAQANLGAAQSTLERARVEVKAASAAQVSSRNAFHAAKELELAKRGELAVARASGDARRVEIAQRELAAATIQREQTATAFKTATDQLATRQTAVQTAATKANTLAQQVNARATQGNLTATRILTLAKQRLGRVMQQIKGAMAANPYAIALASVVALSYAIYKLATRQTEAQQAQEELNETIAAGERSVASEATQVDILFTRLRNAREGTEEYTEARRAIMRQYGDMLKGLGDERHALDDVSKAYAHVREEVLRTARAKSMQRVVEESATKLAEREARAKEEARRILTDRYGREKAEELIIPVRLMLEGREGELSGRHRELMAQMRKDFGKAFDVTRLGGDKFGGGEALRTNALDSLLEGMASYRQAIDETMRRAEEGFGRQDVKPKTDTFDMEHARLQELEARYEKVKAQRESLFRSGDTKGTARKDGELERLNARILARERELRIIAEVKERIGELKKRQEGFSRDDVQYGDLGQRIARLQTRLPEGAKGRTEGGGQPRGEDAIAQRNRTLRAEEDERLRALAEANRLELELRAHRIGQQEEGMDREMAMHRLAFDRLREQLRLKEVEMRRHNREAARLRFEAAHPEQTYEEQGIEDGAYGLSESQRAQLETREQIGREQQLAQDRALLEQLRSEFLTYEQRRLAIAREYARKREALQDGEGGLKEGVSEGNLDELARRESEQQRQLDMQFAQREAAFRTWMRQISDFSLAQLRESLAEAERELARLEGDGQGGSNGAAVARAKVHTLRRQVEEKGEAASLAPPEESTEKWGELLSAVEEVANAFEGLGDRGSAEVARVLGVVAKVGRSAHTVVGGISQLVKATNAGMSASATAAATSIGTVEKASVILSIISATISVATAVAELFDSTEAHNEAMERRVKDQEERIARLRWERSNSEAAMLERRNHLLAQGDAIVRRMHERQHRATWEALQSGEIFRRNARLRMEHARAEAAAVGEMAETMAGMERLTGRESIGQGRLATLQQNLRSIAAENAALLQANAAEASKKKGKKSDGPDQEKIEANRRKFQENAAEFQQLIDEAANAMMGGNPLKLANQLGDAYVNAFRKGQDASAAFGRAVDRMMGDMVASFVKEKFLMGPILDQLNELKARATAGAGGAGYDPAQAMRRFMAGIPATMRNLKAQEAAFREGMERLKAENAEAYDLLAEGQQREAARRGIATASQDSVDEVNGRLTTMQGHTYSISQSMAQLAGTTGRILRSVLAIEAHTANLERLNAMGEDIRAMQSTLGDMQTKGVNVRS